MQRHDLDELVIDALRQEAASVMSASDSRLSSVTSSLSIGAAVAAAGIVAGVNEAAVFCFLPFLMMFPISYAIVVSGDCTGPAEYRAWIEGRLIELTRGRELLVFETKVNAERANANKGYVPLTACYFVLYAGVCAVAIYNGLHLRNGSWGWLCLTGALVSCLAGVVVMAVCLQDALDVGTRTHFNLTGQRSPTKQRFV